MSTAQEPEQAITYKPYMAGLLKRLQSARALVSIAIDKNKTIYNTIIIDVDSKENWLYLDELSLEAAHKSICKGSLIQFQARMKGVQINFQTKVLAIELPTVSERVEEQPLVFHE